MIGTCTCLTEGFSHIKTYISADQCLANKAYASYFQCRKKRGPKSKARDLFIAQWPLARNISYFNVNNIEGKRQTNWMKKQHNINKLRQNAQK